MDVPDRNTIAVDSDVPWLITQDKVQAAVDRIVEISRPRSVMLFGS